MKYLSKAKTFWKSSSYRKGRNIMTAILFCGLGIGYLTFAFIFFFTEGVPFFKVLFLAGLWTLFMLIGWGICFFLRKYFGPFFWKE
jgi:hypothetical protein